MTSKIIVLCGGFSEEKEVSKKSASAIINALIELSYHVERVDPADFENYGELIRFLKSQKPLIIFNALHGAEGENGQLQALFELEKLHYTGSNHTSSAIAMNKYISTLIAQSLSIPTPRQIILRRGETLSQTDVNFLELPFIVKPNSNGSSVGVHIVKDESEVISSVNDAFLYDDQVLCQQFIPGRELTVSILGDKVLPIVEINPLEGFYDYKNKYTKGKTEYICPAKFSHEQTLLVQSFAEKIFNACDCSIYGRVDFRYDGTKFYFLEINTLPGMTELSLTPMAAKAETISFNELISSIVHLSLERTT